MSILPKLLRLETLGPKRLVGQRQVMSLAANTTTELWRGFMQERAALPGGRARYSLQRYPLGYFTRFSPETLFEKWAAQEVADPSFVLPAGFEMLELAGGLYAVFLHQGPASQGAATFQYIFKTWLPGSNYVLDDRPHFELLGEKYRSDAPDSEEEIWLPIKPR
ncbi:GyrI-like domain-containing protein [Hymenobacter bucti]|uniref:GyrI-like domain-containing protein n=1 Tax=Hymenobacter bucti TaxID=1844114 RepID=A0ABW4QU55_9BACT